MKTEIIAINILADIKPKPYRTKMKRLLLISFDIPKDQKKKMDLSSHGKAVCRIPNKKAGRNINISGSMKNRSIFGLGLV
jgi:hypothetical protein